ASYADRRCRRPAAAPSDPEYPVLDEHVSALALVYRRRDPAALSLGMVDVSVVCHRPRPRRVREQRTPTLSGGGGRRVPCRALCRSADVRFAAAVAAGGSHHRPRLVELFGKSPGLPCRDARSARAVRVSLLLHAEYHPRCPPGRGLAAPVRKRPAGLVW